MVVAVDIKNEVIMAASEAVQRDGEAQKLEHSDLEKAITLARKAKREVGPSVPQVTETEVDPSEVPRMKPAAEGTP